jgi:prepilin peptidase CpaA
MLAAAIFVIFPFCMAYAAVSDMLSMTIANRVSLLLVASFMVIAPMTGMDWQTYGMHLAAGFAVLTVTFTLFATGAMGGGDAKLLAATSVWMGYDIVLLQYLVTAGFVGGMLTLAIMSYRGSVLAVFTGHNRMLRNFADSSLGIPYGIGLGIAGLMVFPDSALMKWAVAVASGG